MREKHTSCRHTHIIKTYRNQLISYLYGYESRAYDQLRFRRYEVRALDGPPASVEYARNAVRLGQQRGVNDGETESDSESRTKENERMKNVYRNIFVRSAKDSVLIGRFGVLSLCAAARRPPKRVYLSSSFVLETIDLRHRS